MKKLLLLFVIILSCNSIFAQEKIKGIIEVEGHLYKNDTLKLPFIFNYNLYGVEIKKENFKYKRVKCSIDNCKIIHLIKEYQNITNIKNYLFTPN